LSCNTRRLEVAVGCEISSRAWAAATPLRRKIDETSIRGGNSRA